VSARVTRRALLQSVGAVGAAALVSRRAAPPAARAQAATPAPANGTIVPLTSTSDVFIPPRGRSFQKFSFDFPEPSVAFEGHRFGFMVFTYENAYGLDRGAIQVTDTADGLTLACSRFVWAGGQQTAPGSLTARLRRAGTFVEWDATVEMDQPIRAVSTVVRDVPRGRVSGAGAPFGTSGNNELLFGYPFAGGDINGPGANGSLATPLVLIEESETSCFFLSSLDDRVLTKRFFLQPGEAAYRVECQTETEGWEHVRRFEVPAWRLGRAASAVAAARTHYTEVARAFHLWPWDTRPDVPAWMRRLALAVTLHGQHYTGYIFNDYARQLEILRWIATRIDAHRVLVFLASWDGRYYWDYPAYQADARMGGEDGFRTLIREAQTLGFAMLPMFGANAANRKRPDFERIAPASTFKPDGDRFDITWVDWDNDRHQDGWLSYMNLGVDAWRQHLFDRISDVIDRYHPDAYFLDIVGGYVNNTGADMHAGTRRLVLDLRTKYPAVAAVGEMHYDALLEFIPLYHAFSQTEITDVVQTYGRFFQHLSSPAPGRGSSGVHESGFSRWNPDTLGLRPAQIPTLMVVDDTFDQHRAEMDAVIQAAKTR
jgi:hypothetical protein